MIVSVHIATPGPRAGLRLLRSAPDPASVPGLEYAVTTVAAPIGRPGPPRPAGVAMIAAWEDDAALDEFAARHPLGARLAEGWQVRLEPLRVFGAWAGLPGLPSKAQPQEEDEPVAVLTLGRPRLRRLRPFLKASRPAEADAVADPGLLASTGLARPPRLVSTFSLWRSSAEMRDYAIRQGGGHSAALSGDRERPFHHESAFIRFRPYRSSGSWDGRDPLAGLIRARV